MADKLAIVRSLRFCPVFWCIVYFAMGPFVACELLGPPEPKKYPVVVAVESDPGVPLSGAEVLVNNLPVATSGEDGTAALELAGQEGETRSAMVKCPSGFKSPEQPLTVSLVRLVGAKSARYSVRCAPTERNAVVVVRAQNGPNLPIVHLGKEIGKTDAAGAAHISLRLAPETQFDLKLVTGGAKRRELVPANPVASFTIRDRDDVYVFDQKFKIKKKRVIRRRPPAPSGPTPL